MDEKRLTDPQRVSLKKSLSHDCPTQENLEGNEARVTASVSPDHNCLMAQRLIHVGLGDTDPGIATPILKAFNSDGSVKPGGGKIWKCSGKIPPGASPTAKSVPVLMPDCKKCLGICH